MTVDGFFSSNLARSKPVSREFFRWQSADVFYFLLPTFSFLLPRAS